MAQEIRTGMEVYKREAGTHYRGVVVEDVKMSGPNKGRVIVMWIGGRYMVSEWPEELRRVN